MREFECDDPAIEVNGAVIAAFVAAFGTYKSRGETVVRRHLRNHGNEALDLSPEAFHSLKAFLGAMSELQAQFGSPFMKKVGAFIFDKAVFPPGIDSVETGMQVVDQAYNMNHRHAAGRIGAYRWQAGPPGARAGAMICDVPYPCAFDTGILETIARRFAPEAQVTHAANGCRHEGGTACTYDVRW